MIAGLKERGVQRIIALDNFDFKLDVARRIGADEVVNVRTQDGLRRVREMTGQRGCDVYIENSGCCSGVPQGLEVGTRVGNA